MEKPNNSTTSSFTSSSNNSIGNFFNYSPFQQQPVNYRQNFTTEYGVNTVSSFFNTNIVRRYQNSQPESFNNLVHYFDTIQNNFNGLNERVINYGEIHRTYFQSQRDSMLSIIRNFEEFSNNRDFLQNQIIHRQELLIEHAATVTEHFQNYQETLRDIHQITRELAHDLASGPNILIYATGVSLIVAALFAIRGFRRTESLVDACRNLTEQNQGLIRNLELQHAGNQNNRLFDIITGIIFGSFFSFFRRRR